MYSVATSLDSLLYFRPYNAYAFINAKLQAIKDTTRYYSRKNINEFKEAIYRRKDRKKELLTRK